MGMVIEEKPRILLMEDDMLRLEEISNTLLPSGYDLVYSIAGHDFTELIHSKKFDLVLFNMMIEGLSGFDVLKKIKGSALNHDVPLVFITDEKNKVDLIQGLHVTQIDFLKAPYKREELLTRVNNQIMMLKTSKKLAHSRSITESIRYAERIQKAITPPESLLDSWFADHFLINLPRDIVSGDFHWYKKIDDLILVAVADCTGHGVPGAILSMLGISFLNEICTKAKMENADIILEKLRKKFKETLWRTEDQSPVTDGMDISLIMIDQSKMKLQFASAYHRLLIARGSELTEFKGDLQPIGMHPVEKPFTIQTCSLEKGDRIYMCTDGYVDQFGGEMGKRLQFSNYRKLVREISSKSMAEQKSTFLTEHMDWKGLNDQVDDILMLGIEI